MTYLIGCRFLDTYNIHKDTRYIGDVNKFESVCC